MPFTAAAAMLSWMRPVTSNAFGTRRYTGFKAVGNKVSIGRSRDSADDETELARPEIRPDAVEFPGFHGFRTQDGRQADSENQRRLGCNSRSFGETKVRIACEPRAGKLIRNRRRCHHGADERPDSRARKVTHTISKSRPTGIPRLADGHDQREEIPGSESSRGSHKNQSRKPIPW